MLQTNNVELKNHLRIVFIEKSQNVNFLQRNMETFFGDLEDKFVEKVSLFNNLEDEVKASQQQKMMP